MRKLLCLLFLFAGLLWTASANAQERTITGKVSGEDLRPLAGVTVTLRGTQRRVQTDANGNFSIAAKTGDVLEFTASGRRKNEFTVTANNTVDLVMSNRDDVMSEVVITVMDQRRNPRDLGTAKQTVSGSEIAETQRENFVNGLQGRIAGLTVNPTGGTAGASSQIVLRGFNSLSLDNSPLFVIDGIIVDNSTVNETSNGGTELGLASDRANRGNDYSNRISDINPNDIENITVLKGPEATALYGSQASSGAIIITTKKPANTGRVGVTYDNSFRMQKLTRLPKIMTNYDAGTNGLPQDLFSYFGPEFGIQQPAPPYLWDNLHSFFQTGFSQNHNLALEYGKGISSFRFSGSYFDQESPIPTNTFKRLTGRVTNSTKFWKLEINPSITFVRSENDKPLRGTSGYLLNLLAWPVDNNVRVFEDANGLKVPLYNSNPNADLDNPFYNVYRNRSSDQTDRMTATLGINFNPFNFLTISGRFGYDTYKTTGFTRYDSMSFYVTRAQKGFQDNYYRSFYGYNHTITATARKNLGDFSCRLMVGTMWQDYETQQWAVSGSNLKSFAVGDSNNTDPATRIRLSNARIGRPNYSINRQAAYFGEASIGWKSIVYLTYSHRFEESSIFPEQFRNYNYPAGSVSVIMSDLLPVLKSGSVLSYWKLRGSLASTARSSAPYANQSVFNINTGSGGGYYYAFTNSNPLLRPERQNTYEVGTEFRFFKSRLSLDATYYNTKNTDLIVERFRASYGTGFVLNTLNVGSNQNQGVEITLDGTVTQRKNFRWNMRLNVTRMWNKVTELPSNVPEFYISDTWLYGNARGGLKVGGPTTTITGLGYVRNNRGDILIEPTTGLPRIMPTSAPFLVLGDRNPDLALGYLNNFSYKNLRISFLWDIKIGGDIFNGTERYLTTIGRSRRTIDRTTPRVVKGVLADGLENTDNPTVNNIAIIPYYNQAYFTTQPEEEFIEKDVHWARLRDISLNYTFSPKFTKRLGFVRSLSAFVTVNDLILITNYTGADPAVNGNTAGTRGVGAFGFDYGNVGTPVSANVGFKATF